MHKKEVDKTSNIIEKSNISKPGSGDPNTLLSMIIILMRIARDGGSIILKSLPILTIAYFYTNMITMTSRLTGLRSAT